MSLDKLQSVAYSQWDWNGNFSEATGDGAQFALYLALQFGASVGTPKINAATQSHATARSDAVSPSFYRRPNLKAIDADYSHSQAISDFIRHGDLSSARLYASMHPAPLSVFNDEKRIPDSVLANCSLATQRRLGGDEPQHIDEDNTLLDGVIDKAREYMVA